MTRFVSAKTFSLNLFVICVNHYRRLLKWQKILIIIVDLGIYKYVYRLVLFKCGNTNITVLNLLGIIAFSLIAVENFILEFFVHHFC